MNEKNTVGEILPANAVMLRTHVGHATHTDGELEYEMSLAATAMPLIRSKKTGKFYALKWQDIIALAVEAGVDE